MRWEDQGRQDHGGFDAVRTDHVTQSDLVSLLRDALLLWGMACRPEAGADGVMVAGPDGAAVIIQPGAPPLRWWLTTATRRLPVASIGALLEAVRAAMGAEAGSVARIGAGAAFASPAPPAADPRHGSTPQARGEGLTPVAMITGFLGSGKTTLVSRLLRDPRLARTAVIVNEFGEIGLDHDLIARGDETLVQLTTGCLCCAVQSGIARTLLDLQRRREGGEIAFDRVLVETSGLADPAPILHTLMTDPALGEGFALGQVIALIDVQLGETTLRRHPEATRQASLADVLLLSKTDLATPPDSLIAALRGLNPDAPIVRALTVEALFTPQAKRGAPSPLARHTPDVTGIAIERDVPIPAAALTLFLQAIAGLCGARLLRLKGIVDIAEFPGRPTVIHGVQQRVSPSTLLGAWPAADRRTRIVLLGQGIPPHFPARLLDAIMTEVAGEAGRMRG